MTSTSKYIKEWQTALQQEINYLKKYFVDTDTGNVFTFPAPRAERKIDYIFVKKSNLKRVKNYRVFINDLSDHLPVMADISLK